jgi:prepilin-type N-terminal cleavage/methylation domain-containing protein
MLEHFFDKEQAERGLSLVEMIMVMAILSIVMMAVISLYIPAHRSTVTQTQVSDVQSNLRLAVNRMTIDVMTAGFLVDPSYDSDGSSQPHLPGPIFWEKAPYNDSVTDDFTIRTRLVGRGFARVNAVAYDFAGNIRLPISKSDMVADFPAGSKVRLFTGITASEINQTSFADPTVDQEKRVYNVEGTSGNAIDISDPQGVLVAADILKETVVVRVRDAAQPTVQTIRYRVNNGALERIVNGNVQILARNVDSANFDYDYSTYGNLHLVKIALEGGTKGFASNDPLTSAKRRGVKTAVSVRNSY